MLIDGRDGVSAHDLINSVAGRVLLISFFVADGFWVLGGGFFLVEYTTRSTGAVIIYIFFLTNNL